MNWTFYKSRLWRTFHRLPTLAIPLAYVMVTVSWILAQQLRAKTWFPSLDLTPPQETFLIPLAVGLGALGMDTSEGVLPVLLTRPLPRWSYVLSHWAALATAACFWSLLHLLLQWGLNRAFAFYPVENSEVLYNGAQRISLCIGMSATLVCFSARLPSFGNVLLWLVMYFLVTFVLPGQDSDPAFRLAFLLRRGLEGLIFPALDFRRTFSAIPVSWFRLTTYLSNVSLLLLLGTSVFNRREVSYSSR